MAEAAKKFDAEPFVQPHRCQPAEAARQEWVITVSPTVTTKDLENPAFWALIAPQFRSYARLEVRREDGTMMWDLVVMRAEKTWAEVRVLHEYPLDTAKVKVEEADPYTAKWVSPTIGYRVVRKSDSKVLIENLMSKRELNAWLESNQHLLTG